MRCPIKCCLQSKEIDQGTIAKGLCDIVGQDQVKACVRAAKVEAEAEATMSVDALREKVEAICRFLGMPEAQLTTVLQQLATQSQPQHVNYLRRLQEAQAKHKAKAEATMSVDALRERIEAICRFLKMPEAQLAMVLQQLATQSQPQHVTYLRRLQEAQAKHKEQLRVWEAQQRAAEEERLRQVELRRQQKERRRQEEERRRQEEQRRHDEQRRALLMAAATAFARAQRAEEFARAEAERKEHSEDGVLRAENEAQVKELPVVQAEDEVQSTELPVAAEPIWRPAWRGLAECRARPAHRNDAEVAAEAEAKAEEVARRKEAVAASIQAVVPSRSKHRQSCSIDKMQDGDVLALSLVLLELDQLSLMTLKLVNRHWHQCINLTLGSALWLGRHVALESLLTFEQPEAAVLERTRSQPEEASCVSALHLALMHGYGDEVILALLKAAPAQLRMHYESYMSPMHLKMAPPLHTILVRREPLGAAALEIVRRDPGSARMRLRIGDYEDPQSLYPLHLAALRPDAGTEFMRALISASKRVIRRAATIPGQPGQPLLLPLQVATRRGAPMPIITMLLEAWPPNRWKATSLLRCNGGPEEPLAVAQLEKRNVASQLSPSEVADAIREGASAAVISAAVQANTELATRLLPARRQMEPGERCTRLLLHDAVQFGAGVDVISVLVTANPHALRSRDEYGDLPLQLATKRRAIAADSSEERKLDAVMDLLRRAWPAAANELGTHGEDEDGEVSLSDTDVDSDASLRSWMKLEFDSDLRSSSASRSSGSESGSESDSDSDWKPGADDVGGRSAEDLPWWLQGCHQQTVDRYFADRDMTRARERAMMAALDRSLEGVPAASNDADSEGYTSESEASDASEVTATPAAAATSATASIPSLVRQCSANDCPICLEHAGVLEGGVHFEQFPQRCGHFFCSDCLAKVNLRQGCPLCRAGRRDSEDEDESDESETASVESDTSEESATSEDEEEEDEEEQKEPLEVLNGQDVVNMLAGIEAEQQQQQQ